MDAAIGVRGLRKSYGGRPVVADLELSIASGECFALLGADGRAALFMRFGNVLGDSEREAPIRLDLVGARFLLEESDRLPQPIFRRIVGAILLGVGVLVFFCD